MNKEELKEYFKRTKELEKKLTGEDKETIQWIIYGYNRCAKKYFETLEELERYKNIIDELILTGLASSITKEDFEYMWKVAYNKEYNPNDIKEIAERRGILKGE